MFSISASRRCTAAVLSAMMIFGQSGLAQTATKKKVATKSRAASNEEVKELKQLILQLTEQVQKDRQDLDSLRTQLADRDAQAKTLEANTVKAAAAADKAQQDVATVAQTSQATATHVAQIDKQIADADVAVKTASKKVDDRLSMFEGASKRFRFSGDIRLRGEAVEQNNTQDRNRGLIRFRFATDGKLGEDFVGGIAISTGALNNGGGSNDTLGNDFNRKAVSFDRGYITYNPHNAKWMSITGGKFAFNFQRTAQTFDPDFNPEGVSEKFSFDLKNSVVKNITFTGLQLVTAEFANAADAFAVGGQISTKLQLGRVWTMTPSYTVLNWHNADVFLNQLSSVTGGTANGPFAPNGMTNSTYKDANGVLRFTSKYLYSDLIVNNTFKTGFERMPFNLSAEYLNNLQAKNDQSHAYLFDTGFGQMKNKNDIQFGYAFLRQEQDSAIASFIESEQRAPTNVVIHRPYFSWKVRSNLNFVYTGWIGRTLDYRLQNAKVVTPGQKDPWQKKSQFDFIYSF